MAAIVRHASDGEQQQAAVHPILSKIQAINKDYVQESDWATAPVDRQQFLDWWWEIKARACESCVLSENRTLVVKPDGLLLAGDRPMIMIVGEGPGALEDTTGLPMVSPLVLRASRCGSCAGVHDCYSHKLLDRPDSRHPRNKAIVCKPRPQSSLQLRDRFYLQSAGAVLDGLLIGRWRFNYPRQSWIDLHNAENPDRPWTQGSPWYVTNTILCRSFDPLTRKDVAPGTASKNICRRWLTWQWAAVQPKIVLCLGIPALEAFTQPRERPQVVQGEIFHSAKFGPIIYQPHPAHVMREENAGAKALGFAKLGESLRRSLEFAGYPTN